jgi:hypothetical protein
MLTADYSRVAANPIKKAYRSESMKRKYHERLHFKPTGLAESRRALENPPQTSGEFLT